MRKPIALILALTIALSLAACGSEPVEETTVPAETTQPIETTAVPTEATTEPPITTIAETVIYNDNGITITATGMEEHYYGIDITFLVENNSSYDIEFYNDYFDVNGGITIDSYTYIDLPAGKKAYSTIGFGADALDRAGITDIATVNGIATIRVMDTDKYLEVPINLETSIAGTYTQGIDTTGEVMFDQSGLTVLENDGYFTADALVLEMTMINSTDQHLSMDLDDISINDFMMSYSLGCPVLPNTVRYEEVWFYYDDFGLSGINPEDVKTLEFTLSAVCEEDGYYTALSSEHISKTLTMD